MARIKQEVKEQARHARQAHRLSTSPVVAPSAAPEEPTPEPLVAVAKPIAPPAPSVTASPGGCIDLTLDDETEDEEEADEPLGRRASLEAERPAPSSVAASLPVGATSSRGTEPPRQEPEVLVQDSSATEDDVESDVDEELPQALPSRPHESVQLGEEAVGELNAPTSVVESHSGGGMQQSEECRTEDIGAEADDEEEEDEALPVSHQSPVGEETEPMDVEMDEALPVSATASTVDSSEDSSQVTKAAKATGIGESLEDGEIFEEGAVAKSPTAIKEAIAQARQAESISQQPKKKKNKKRGKKNNNKRKVELLQGEPVDEFGRSVRHQPVAPHAMPPPHLQMNPLMPTPPLGPTPPQTYVSPPRPLRPVPPPPEFMMHHPPPPPAAPHMTPQRGFMDEHIVRVNRHGGVEVPFNGHHHPVPPMAPHPLPPPSMLMVPPPGSVQGGFRYVSVDHFAEARNANAPRARMKRQLSQPTPDQQVEREEERDEIDLDSLRAAALRTKRKTPDKRLATKEDESVDVEKSEEKASAPTAAEDEEEPSLDALRMQLLQSMRQKKPRPTAINTQQVVNYSSHVEFPTPEEDKAEPTKQASAGVENGSSLSERETSTERVVVVKEPAARPTPPLPPVVLESPQVRPLTALSQSVVIRLSLDELESTQSKRRAESYDATDATLGFDKGAQDPPAWKQDPTRDDSTTRQAKSGATDAAGSGEVSKKLAVTAKEKVGCVETTGEAVDLDNMSVEQLETELECSSAAVNEADGMVARLDADIAALRRAIAEKEAAAAASVAVSEG